MEIQIQKKEYLTQVALDGLKTTTQGILQTSKACHEYHESYGYQEYMRWVREDLKISERMGRSVLNVYNQFGVTANFAVENIQPSVLYLLSAPSTPEKAKSEILERSEQGEKISTKEAQELIKAHKAIAEKKAQVSMLENTIKSLQSKLPTEDVLSKISTLESQLAEARNKPIRDPQLEQDLLTAQTRARALEESLIEAQNKPAQLVEKIVKIKDEEALAKLQREKKTYQDKANAMTHELANYERRIKELESQIEVDNPNNIDVATAQKLKTMLKIISMDAKFAVEDAIRIGGVLDETKEVLSAMISNLKAIYNLADSVKVIEYQR